MWPFKVKKIKFTLEPSTKTLRYCFFNLDAFVEKMLFNDAAIYQDYTASMVDG